MPSLCSPAPLGLEREDMAALRLAMAPDCCLARLRLTGYDAIVAESDTLASTLARNPWVRRWLLYHNRTLGPPPKTTGRLEALD